MRILMIALHYHDYTHAIADEFRLAGHSVSLHDIMPRSTAMKALRVLAPQMWQDRVHAHHQAILDAERDNSYDMVFFLQVHQMALGLLDEFRSTFASARFLLYNWDSTANHDYRPHLDRFDQALTFDPVDARALNIGYLPLFCVRRLQALFGRGQDRPGLYFIGNVVKPARYEALDAFRRYCAGKDLALATFAACTPPVRLAMVRQGIIPSGLASGEISKADFEIMVTNCSTVFDFANHQQSGFTMRIFENLCMGKKIVSNNPLLLTEGFYSPDRIHTYSDLDFEGIAEFVAVPLAEPTRRFEEYGVEAFAGHLLTGRGHAR
jgi:hypothetical protein